MTPEMTRMTVMMMQTTPVTAPHPKRMMEVRMTEDHLLNHPTINVIFALRVFRAVVVESDCSTRVT